MRVFIEEQDNAKAMRLAQQAIGVNPEFYSAHALLSEIYFAQGEDQKAVNALYFGAHAAPRDADIWQGVADACLRLRTIDRETALRQALNCFRRIIEIDEHNHNALFQRAAIFHEMKSLNRALREYEGLLKVMPHNTSVIRRQAPLLLELDRVDEAIKVCEDSIAHGKGTGTGAEDEFSWPDIVVYTDILVQCGRLEEAILKLKRLSRWLVDRDMEDFWDEVVGDDREWDSEHEPRRVEAVGFHVNLSPNELYGQALPLELRVKLGLYRLMQGLDYRIEAFGHFEWLTPDNLEHGAPVYTHPELFLDTAKALKDVKEHHEALRYYEALLATEAYSDTSFWLQVAATSFICEKTEQSRICYESAKTADRNCVEARTQLGMLYAGLGDKAKALQNAEEAVEMATRGIKKSDRRRYEKKDQKAARKAAERVLKIARRLERPRKKRPPRSLGPAQLKRKQIAIDRKAQKLATKIQKQTKIYERKVSKNTAAAAAERSKEIWTSKMKQLYANLTELTPAMRDGDPQARIAWLGLAQQLIEDFCSTEALFPSERHLSFQGYKKVTSKKSQGRLDPNRPSTATADDQEQGGSTKTTWSDLHDDYHLPTEHRNIPFSSWLDIFLETALLHAKSGAQWKEACYALLRSAHDCIAWHHESAALLKIFTCYFACALELHDEHTLLFTVGRWFVKEYRFCTDAYRLFAALNLFYIDENGGKPIASQSEFRNPTTQKFMLRQMGALDARLPEDYNEHGEEGLIPRFMRTTFAHGLDNVQEDGAVDRFTDDLKPKEMDVVLLCLYGHIMFAGDTFVSALNYFYRALTLDPKNPMVLLSIALCYAHELAKRGTEDRHMHVLNAMAVFDEYAEARLEQASGRGARAVAAARREVEFNRARLWQMLGLSDLALREYHKVLQPIQCEDSDSASKEWSMKAAFAASNIYASNGDPAMAKYITERWLVVE
jgi:general transcription factor 3C polypeptide 3 (transcription factor C subunit 4)